MAVTWDKTMFDLAYQSSGEPDGHPNTRDGIIIHYNRYSMFPTCLQRAQKFIQLLNLNPSMKILLLGCGFGWTAEALNGMGYINCIGTDISTYIQNNKGTSEASEYSADITAVGLDPSTGEGAGHLNRLLGSGIRTNATILNEDSSTTSSRNRVKQALGGGRDIVITEDVVTSLSDTECATLQSSIVKYAVPVCHFVTEFANPNPPFNFNSKSIDQWKALFPTSTIITDGTWKIL